MGRIIGKGGATIREIETRSKAKVSVQEGKGSAGMVGRCRLTLSNLS
jgi:rRNA processing protein Krr1/Pno1